MCGWHVKLCDPSLTLANLNALETSTAHLIRHHTNVLFTYLLPYCLHLVCVWANVYVSQLVSTQLYAQPDKLLSAHLK